VRTRLGRALPRRNRGDKAVKRETQQEKRVEPQTRGPSGVDGIMRPLAPLSQRPLMELAACAPHPPG
jgi:hypothetical protein